MKIEKIDDKLALKTMVDNHINREVKMTEENKESTETSEEEKSNDEETTSKEDSEDAE